MSHKIAAHAVRLFKRCRHFLLFKNFADLNSVLSEIYRNKDRLDWSEKYTQLVNNLLTYQILQAEAL